MSQHPLKPLLADRQTMVARRLVVAGAVSAFGDGLTALALGLAALSLTSDARLVTGVFIASQLPWLAGLSLSKRVDELRTPGRALIFADLVRLTMVTVTALSFALGFASIPLLFVTAAVLAAGEIVHRAATLVIIPVVTDDDDRAHTFGRLESARSLFGSILGPAAGGAAFSAARALPFVGDAVTFAASAAIVAPVRDLDVRRGEQPVTRIAARAAIGLAWNHPLLRVLLTLSAVLGFSQSMVLGLAPIYARQQLGLSDSGFGIFLAFTTIGAVLGGLAAPRLWRAGRRTAAVLIVTLAVDAAVYVAAAQLHSAVAAALLFFAFACATSVLNVVSATLRATFAHPDARGRIGILFGQVISAAQPIGALLAGQLARSSGVPTAFTIAGATLGLAVLAFALPLRRAVALAGA